jgi:uncharacterized tellurite resistance protein B-like protein
MIRRYSRNSPEAIARVLAMALLTDAAVDDREMDLFERLDLLREIGLTREGFSRVVADYCDDIGATGGGPLAADAALVDAVIADVDDPRKRLMACAMMLSLCYADGRFAPSEVAVMRQVLRRWGLALESLQAYGAGPRRPAARGARPVARHLRRERRWGEEVGEARGRERSLAE